MFGFVLGQVQFSFEWAVVIAITVVACATDIRSRRVPNMLTGPAWILGLVWAFSQGGWTGLGDGFAASLILALPYVLLFVFAGGGAGDAKLMAAVGAWLGIMNGLLALFAIALCGTVIAIGVAIHHKRFRSVMTYVKQSVCAVLYTVSSRTPTLEIVSAIDTEIGAQTRHQIEQAHEAIDAAGLGHHPGKSRDQGHGGLVVEEAPAVIAVTPFVKRLSVVRGDDDGHLRPRRML